MVLGALQSTGRLLNSMLAPTELRFIWGLSQSLIVTLMGFLAFQEKSKLKNVIFKPASKLDHN